MMVGEAYQEVYPYQGDEPEGIFRQLEDSLNSFRFSHCDHQRYDRLSSVERLAIPSIELQVGFTADKIQEWLGDTVSSCVSSIPDEDELLHASTQLHGLCACAQTTHTMMEYWQQNYPQRSHNEFGRFTEWRVRRTVRPIFQESLARLALAQPDIGPVKGTLLESVPSLDPAKIAAKDKDLRRTAYVTRLDTKIGLACMQVFPLDFSQNVLELSAAEPDIEEAPDLMTMLRDSQDGVLDFVRLPEAEDREVEPMPF